MNNKPRFTVIKVDNGFILKWINRGRSILKEPYEQDVMVFEQLTKLLNYIDACMQEQV